VGYIANPNRPAADLRTVVLERCGTQVRAMDSVAYATTEDSGHFIVTGSHGGLSAGEYAARIGPMGVACSDAGIGRNAAGVAGLRALDRLGIVGIGVSHMSARIGDGMDQWRHGVVSFANDTALRARVVAGMRLAEAVEIAIPWMDSHRGHAAQGEPTPLLRRILVSGASLSVVALDSISILDERDRGQIIVAGSNGGTASGTVARHQRCALVALNDAGIGKDDAGVAGLAAVDADGIPGVGVGHESAEISNAIDMWEHGVVSYANRSARSAGAAVGERLQSFVIRFLRESGGSVPRSLV
jgi:hypothetical protein